MFNLRKSDSDLFYDLKKIASCLDLHIFEEIKIHVKDNIWLDLTFAFDSFSLIKIILDFQSYSCILF